MQLSPLTGDALLGYPVMLNTRNPMIADGDRFGIVVDGNVAIIERFNNRPHGSFYFATFKDAAAATRFALEAWGTETLKVLQAQAESMGCTRWFRA